MTVAEFYRVALFCRQRQRSFFKDRTEANKQAMKIADQALKEALSKVQIDDLDAIGQNLANCAADMLHRQAAWRQARLAFLRASGPEAERLRTSSLEAEGLAKFEETKLDNALKRFQQPRLIP